MKTPEDRDRRLVQDVASAFEVFHGEKRGDLACFLQAVTMLVKHGPLYDYEPSDFVEFKELIP
jgi:hypothetical protein